MKEIIKCAVQQVVSLAVAGINKNASFSDVVSNTKMTVEELGCRILEHVFKEIENRFDKQRDRHKIIVRNRNKSRTLLTELGEIKLKHTLYFDKNVGRYFLCY